jgi:hypothetical protein
VCAGWCGKRKRRASQCGKQEWREGPSRKTITVSKIVVWLAHFNGCQHQLAHFNGSPHRLALNCHFPHWPVWLSNFPHQPAWLRDFPHRLARLGDFPHWLARLTLLPCLSLEKSQTLFNSKDFRQLAVQHRNGICRSRLCDPLAARPRLACKSVLQKPYVSLGDGA